MPADLNSEARLAVYIEVSSNYRAIDDLRLRLLALLPLATGTGVLLFLGGDGIRGDVAVPVGLFGMIATVSLYFYELHGVEKCAHFIYRGQLLERQLKVRGSFRYRPQHIFGVVSELLPTMIIYPASFASWLFIALYPLDQKWFGVDLRLVVSAVALGVAATASTVMVRKMERTRPDRRIELERDEDALHPEAE